VGEWRELKCDPVAGTARTESLKGQRNTPDHVL
jgi:hypothetical protein